MTGELRAKAVMPDIFQQFPDLLVPSETLGNWQFLDQISCFVHFNYKKPKQLSPLLASEFSSVSPSLVLKILANDWEPGIDRQLIPSIESGKECQSRSN